MSSWQVRFRNLLRSDVLSESVQLPLNLLHYRGAVSGAGKGDCCDHCLGLLIDGGDRDDDSLRGYVRRFLLTSTCLGRKHCQVVNFELHLEKLAIYQCYRQSPWKGQGAQGMRESLLEWCRSRKSRLRVELQRVKQK